ncbi:MAG: UDP-N-acetylglucosamine 1-carboxyvinyltransferase [Defluviitaleaceae bacterium]|nr:UDP-N-acetylglucosamine 1-carboxyvinyltransferase [Defluviitaleaceae bacterium]MCL2274878.1 UDP-N-acetylglucosamine 1-carboxyvinyltransferase [Defluviitaleaceae bacterium]
MRKYRIRGGNRISGVLRVGGGKNAALPILAATLLAEGESIIHNCPDIADIRFSVEILRHLGCRVNFEENTLNVNATNITNAKLPTDLVCKMRSSILFMGALLGRCREVEIASPGGCQIGARPIDLHISGFQKMGVSITENGDLMHAKSPSLTGAWIYLRDVSVGATENLLLAAVLAEGETVLVNAAREPEIVDLAKFLISMGANIRGAGTSTLKIMGVKRLQAATHRIMPDRIVTGTYLLAAAMTRGDLTLTHVNPYDISAVTAQLRTMGCQITEHPAQIRLHAPHRLTAIPHLITEAHPGFPTDMQAPFVAALATAKGTSVVEERIFEARAAHATELNRMGARIILAADNRVFVIKGREKLYGTSVNSHDLRGGAAMVLAALAAEGETIVHDPGYIARGYDDIAGALCAVGGDVGEVNLS